MIRIIAIASGLTIAFGMVSGCDSKDPNTVALSQASSGSDNSNSIPAAATGSTATSTTSTTGSTTDQSSTGSDQTDPNAPKTKVFTLDPSFDPNTTATLHTNLGDIVVRFFPDKAPGHVANFLDLVKKKFYDKTKFHRVIPGFMIQGGDPLSQGSDRGPMGTGGPGYQIKAEFNDVDFKHGILGMARSQDPDSAGSQFYIMQADSPHLNKQYTAFGQVVKGLDVVDKIAHLKRDSRDNPLDANPAIIESVTIGVGKPEDFPKIPIIGQ